MTEEEVKEAIARHTELVQYRKDVVAGRIRPAHDGEILMAMEEERLRVKILSHFSK